MLRYMRQLTAVVSSPKNTHSLISLQRKIGSLVKKFGTFFTNAILNPPTSLVMSVPSSSSCENTVFDEPYSRGSEMEKSGIETTQRRGKFGLRFPTFTFTPDSKVIYDAILGLSDGLTVPFALTAGLASVGSTRIVIMGGLAELIAGAISMGLGGFVGSMSEAESYEATLRKCNTLITSTPNEVRDIIDKHFKNYIISEEDRRKVTNGLFASRSDLERFLLTHHYETSQPDTSRPYISAVTLGLSYFLGGFIALIPYLCVKPTQIHEALYISIGIMAFVMFAFGYIKTGVVRGWRGRDNVYAGLKGAVQMLVIGALAVGAAVGLVKAIESGHHY